MGSDIGRAVLRERFIPTAIARIKMALSLLPEQTRLDLTPAQTSVVIAAAAGLEHGEIANLFGLTEGTVGSMLVDARKASGLSVKQMIYVLGFQEGKRHALCELRG